MPSSLQPPNEPLDSYVLPLLVVTKTGPTTSRVVRVVETGFLVADGRGLGVTAGHVAKNYEDAIGGREYPAVAFRQANAVRKIVPVAKFERHPREDVALFRLALEDDFHSPYTSVPSYTPHLRTTMLSGSPTTFSMTSSP